MEELPSARLEDLRNLSLRDGARAMARGAADLDFGGGRDRSHNAIAVVLLEKLCLLDANMQTNRDVVGEVIAANGNHRGVGDSAFEENHNLRGAGADIDQAGAQFPLIRGDRRFGRRLHLRRPYL